MKTLTPILIVSCLLVIHACSTESSQGNGPESNSVSATDQSPHPLDLASEFRPDMEYFRAGLVTLHFITEVYPIPKVDTFYRDLITAYELPVSAEGAADGSYHGASPPDAYDYTHEVWIRIEDEKIVEVDYDEIHPLAMGKQNDTAYCRKMSISGSTPAQSYPAMEKQLLETQDLWKVDALSGSTYSLYRFRYAVMVALMQAVAAK